MRALTWLTLGFALFASAAMGVFLLVHHGSIVRTDFDVLEIDESTVAEQWYFQAVADRSVWIAWHLVNPFDLVVYWFVGRVAPAAFYVVLWETLESSVSGFGRSLSAVIDSTALTYWGETPWDKEMDILQGFLSLAIGYWLLQHLGAKYERLRPERRPRRELAAKFLIHIVMLFMHSLSTFSIYFADVASHGTQETGVSGPRAGQFRLQIGAFVFIPWRYFLRCLLMELDLFWIGDTKGQQGVVVEHYHTPDVEEYLRENPDEREKATVEENRSKTEITTVYRDVEFTEHEIMSYHLYGFAYEFGTSLLTTGFLLPTYACTTVWALIVIMLLMGTKRHWYSCVFPNCKQTVYMDNASGGSGSLWKHY